MTSQSTIHPAPRGERRARHQCPCDVVVITFSQSVADWARQPIVLGAGGVLRPLVIGPEQIPVITGVVQARESLDLALLSVYAHGRTKLGSAVGRAALQALEQVNRGEDMLYFYEILGALSRRAFRELEESMQLERPEWVPKHVPKRVWEFLARIEDRVREEVEDKATRVATARAVLRVLQARGISVTVAEASRITDCQDLATLESWLDRALQADAASELFH